MNDYKKYFDQPSSLEYPEYFRGGMGTENVGPFLRALVQMIRPNRVLEIGAGYSSPFLLEGLINNENVFNDGNLDLEYLRNLHYDPRLVIIEDMSLGDLTKNPYMKAIVDSEYVEFVEGLFQGKARQLFKKYGAFDFVWFDCGGEAEYRAFFDEYWNICSGYVICHFTFSKGIPNDNLRAALDLIGPNVARLDILEPHKTSQGSVTIFKK